MKTLALHHDAQKEKDVEKKKASPTAQTTPLLVLELQESHHQESHHKVLALQEVAHMGKRYFHFL